MSITVSLDEVKEFVTSKLFLTFLVDHTSSFETAVFILQTILDKIDSEKEKMKENE